MLFHSAKLAILLIGINKINPSPNVDDVSIEISRGDYFQICCLFAIFLNCTVQLLQSSDFQTLTLIERALEALEKDLEGLKISKEELKQVYQGVNSMICVAALIQKFCIDFGNIEPKPPLHPNKIQSTVYQAGNTRFSVELFIKFLKLFKAKISRFGKEESKCRGTFKKIDLKDWLLKSALNAQAFIGVNIEIKQNEILMENIIIYGFLALHTWIACILLFVRAFNVRAFNPDIDITDDKISLYVDNFTTYIQLFNVKFPTLAKQLGVDEEMGKILQTDHLKVVAIDYLKSLKDQLSDRDIVADDTALCILA